MGESSDGPEERQHERAEHVEAILDAAETDAQTYPASSDELAAEYRAAAIDLGNETETLGDAFDRLADEYSAFDSPAEAREALTTEVTREERFDETFTDDPTQQ